MLNYVLYCEVMDSSGFRGFRRFECQGDYAREAVEKFLASNPEFYEDDPRYPGAGYTLIQIYVYLNTSPYKIDKLPRYQYRLSADHAE